MHFGTQSRWLERGGIANILAQVYFNLCVLEMDSDVHFSDVSLSHVSYSETSTESDSVSRPSSRNSGSTASDGSDRSGGDSWFSDMDDDNFSASFSSFDLDLENDLNGDGDYTGVDGDNDDNFAHHINVDFRSSVYGNNFGNMFQYVGFDFNLNC